MLKGFSSLSDVVGSIYWLASKVAERYILKPMISQSENLASLSRVSATGLLSPLELFQYEDPSHTNIGYIVVAAS